MKRIIINLTAFLFIGIGGLYMSANATPKVNAQSLSSCLDMGCIGGNLNCYSPPGGGMCYTGGKVPVEAE